MGLVKKTGLGLLVLLAVPLVAILVLQAVIDPNDYKETIRQIAAKQNIDLMMKGDIHWSFFPAPAFTVEEIDAVLLTGGDRLPLHIATLKIALAIAPLLSRNIEFHSVEIKGASAKNLNDIDLLIEDLNSSGRSFPVTLSLVFVQDAAVQLPIQLKAEANVNLADKQAARIALDPLDITIDNSSIAGSIQWQQGSPDHIALNLHSDQLIARNVKLTNVQMSAVMDGKKITLQSFDANAYHGKIHSSGSIDITNSKTAPLRLDTEIKDMQLASFLADLQQKPAKILAGNLQLDSRLTAMPLSQAGMLKTLSGDLKFSVDGLVIDEMNLEKRVCEAAAKLDGKALTAKQWPEKTGLRETRGVVRIQNGIMMMTPLVAKLDTLDLNGIGPVSLLDDTMDLRLDLTAIDNQKAVNACEIMNPRLTEISWPLRCRGNFATQSGKELCNIDQSRLDKLVFQAAEQKLGEKLKEKMGKDGEKLNEALKKLFH
ncbi:MAG TPA: AsmA family protein [Pseudomonadales bacterium]|nr:AsmA family protein [Pseudomonadales bacterium]